MSSHFYLPADQLTPLYSAFARCVKKEPSHIELKNFTTLDWLLKLPIVKTWEEWKSECVYDHSLYYL